MLRSNSIKYPRFNVTHYCHQGTSTSQFLHRHEQTPKKQHSGQQVIKNTKQMSKKLFKQCTVHEQHREQS